MVSSKGGIEDEGALDRRMRATILTAPWAALIVWLSVLCATVGIPLFAYSMTPSNAAAPVVGLVVALAMCAWSVRAIRRLCARVVPLSPGGGRMLVPELACMAGCALAAVVILDAIQRLVSARDLAAGFMPGWLELTAAGTWCVALALQARQYSRPSSTQGPYVLYLRTFRGFSDRAMTAALFTVVGGRKRVVVLTAPHSDAASWDPVLIAFRGNPLLRLSAKSPVFLRATDRDWERSVRQLVDGASQIVIDISDMSRGVRAELEMLGRPGTSEKVIWLSEATQADRLPQVRALVGGAHMPPDRVIFYERSWTAALPNMLIGLCLSEFPFWLSADIGALSNLLAVRDLTPRELGSLLGTFTGRSAPGLLTFTAIFARPAVDRRTQKTLRTLLAGS